MQITGMCHLPFNCRIGSGLETGVFCAAMASWAEDTFIYAGIYASQLYGRLIGQIETNLETGVVLVAVAAGIYASQLYGRLNNQIEKKFASWCALCSGGNRHLCVIAPWSNRQRSGNWCASCSSSLRHLCIPALGRIESGIEAVDLHVAPL